MELPAVPESVRMARRQGREVLHSWHLSADGIETLELLLSEIVTNAIRYGGTQRPFSANSNGRDRVRVVMRYVPDELVIEVSDSNQIPPVLGLADKTTPGWRGLNIVNDLSRKWGYYNVPPSGKTVYCMFACGLCR
jgi:two-component sensor histidine kinase